MKSVTYQPAVLQATNQSLTAARERLLAWILANEAKRRAIGATHKITAMTGSR